MTGLLGDTTLGRLLNLVPKSTKLDPELGSSSWRPAQDYESRLKLETVIIPAAFGHGRKDAMEALEKTSGQMSLSVGSTLSLDTKANSDQLVDAECQIGWDGKDDPEVR